MDKIDLPDDTEDLSSNPSELNDSFGRVSDHVDYPGFYSRLVKPYDPERREIWPRFDRRLRKPMDHNSLRLTPEDLEDRELADRQSYTKLGRLYSHPVLLPQFTGHLPSDWTQYCATFDQPNDGTYDFLMDRSRHFHLDERDQFYDDPTVRAILSNAGKARRGRGMNPMSAFRSRSDLLVTLSMLNEPDDFCRRGMVDIRDGKINVILGRKRPKAFTEDDVSKKFFRTHIDLTDGKYGYEKCPWGALLFTPDFYKQCVHPLLSGKEANTPFDWALERTETILAVLVEWGLSSELLLPAIEFPLQETAGSAINVGPETLDQSISFPDNDKNRALLKELSYGGRDPNPEEVYFVLKHSDVISPEDLRKPKVRQLFVRFEAWLNNGLIIFRVDELFEAGFEAAKGADLSEVLVLVFEAVDNVYGGEKSPWYFLENQDLAGQLRAIIAIQPDRPLNALADYRDLAKAGGFDTMYTVPLYQKAGKSLETYLPREKMCLVLANITRLYGIGNPGRAQRVLDLFTSGIAKVFAEEREEFIKLFLGHAERNRPSSLILSRLEGDYPSFPLTGLGTAFAALQCQFDDGEKEKFDELTFTPELLDRLGCGFNFPVSSRRELPPPLSDKRVQARHRLMPRQQAKGQLTAGARAELTQDAERSGGDVLFRVLRFYELCRKELGADYDPDSFYSYFSFIAQIMKDPLNPPPEVVRALAGLIRVSNSYGISLDQILPRLGFKKAKEPSKESVRDATLMFAFAAVLKMLASNDGELSPVALELAGFIAGDDIEVAMEPKDEYVRRKYASRRAGIEKSASASGEDWTEEEIREHLERLDQCLKNGDFEDEYDSEREKTKTAMLVERARDFVQGVQIIKDIRHVAEATDSLEFFGDEEVYKNWLERMKSVHGSSAPKSTDSAVYDADDDDDGRTKWSQVATNFLDPYRLVAVGEFRFEEILQMTMEKGEIDKDRFKAELAKRDPEERAAYLFEVCMEIRLSAYLRDLIKEAEATLCEATVDQTVERHLLSISKDLGRIEELLGKALFEGVDPRVSKFVFLVEKGTRVLLARLRAARESLATFGAIRDMQKFLDELLPEGNGGSPKGNGQISGTRVAVAKATNAVLRLFGTARAIETAKAQSADGEDAFSRGLLTPAVTESKLALPAPSDSDLSFSIWKRPPLRRELLKDFQRHLPEILAWLEKVRMDRYLLSPTGGKIHVLKPVDAHVFERLKDLLGLKSTPFRLIHAGKSVIVPPGMTPDEFAAMVYALQRYGFIDDEFMELQVGCSGRILDPFNLGVLATSVMLSTEKCMTFPKDSFCTTTGDDNKKPTDPTASRMLCYDAYDATMRNEELPGVRLANGELLTGRTDILGRRIASDAMSFTLAHSVLLHSERGFPFAEVGQWFKDEHSKLLEKYGLLWTLEVPWVFKNDDEKAKPNLADQKKHFEAVTACTDAWFKCKDGGSQVVFEARELFDELARRIRTKQTELKADPGQYERVASDWNDAVELTSTLRALALLPARRNDALTLRN